jgi:signal transduction histidine kinase
VPHDLKIKSERSDWMRFMRMSSKASVQSDRFALLFSKIRSFDWEKFFSRQPTQYNFAVLVNKGLLSTAIGLIGFLFTSCAYKATGTYFTSVPILATILIAILAGGYFSVASAIVLAMVCDYHFIPPIGQFLVNAAGWIHLGLLVTFAMIAAYLASSVRNAYIETVKAKQLLSEANTQMEKLLSFVSHDLRNPLAVVAMSVGILLRKGKNPEVAKDLLERSLRNLNEMDLMIGTLLDATSYKSGQSFPLQISFCDLADEIRKVLAEQSTARRRRVLFSALEPVRGHWGVSEIRRALLNLISNAENYGDTEAPIEVLLSRHGDRATLSVKNYGRDIPLEDQKNIFESFQRSAASGSSNIKGWGLGLALVKAVAEAHGGDVHLESARGLGTTFTLALPIRKEAQI